LIEAADITALLLCGGKGARLGGQDKPLLSLGSDKIIDHLLTRLKPQTGEVVISCSRNVARYEAYELRIVVDEAPDEGPLGGLQSAFKTVNTEWALTCPGDIPFLTSELVTRLSLDAERQGVAVPFADNERQNLCLLINRKRRNELVAFYAQGGRAVKRWLDIASIQSTDLSELGSSFFNVNTARELEEAIERSNHPNQS
jgi:molybdopterin-guanine dinucleotide biosynthesis protein A